MVSGVNIWFLFMYFSRYRLRISSVLATIVFVLLILLQARYYMRFIRNPHPDQVALNLLFVTFFQFILLFISTLSVFARSYREPLVGWFTAINVKGRTIFLVSLLLWSSIVILYSPMTVFISSWAEFEIAALQLLFRQLVIFISVLLIGYALFRIVPDEMKVLMVYMAVIAAVMFWVYTYLIPGDFGHLDNFELSNPSKLYNPNRLYQLLEAAAIVTGVGLIVLLFRKFSKYVLAALVILNLMSFGQATVGLFASGALGKNHPDVLKMAEGRVPDYTRDLLSLSREENVVVVMLDMFTGGFLPRILEEYPDLYDGLEGFTWYANTLSCSDNTFASIPAIVGGEKYCVQAGDTEESVTLVERYQEAFQFFPEYFESMGYKLAYIDPSYMGYTGLDSNPDILVGYSRDFVPYWQSSAESSVRGDTNIPPAEYSRIFTVIGLFKGSPFILKPYIYYKASWLKTNSGNVKIDHVVDNLALLDALPELSSADASDKSFLYFNSMFTHIPWAMDENGRISRAIIRDEPSHRYYSDVDALLINPKLPFHTNAKALSALSEWFDWMRQEDIYDNTRIVIVSDHGYSGVNPMTEDHFKVILDSEGNRLDGSGRAHALLLVKDFGETGRLKRSDRLMSNADTAMLATKGHPLAEDTGDREVVISFTPAIPADNGEYAYVLNGQFAVSDSIFDPENWTDLLNREH